MLTISKKKSGNTLVEIIISLAIIAIIIIPVSNMILTSVRTNRSAQDKQQAAYIAQQIIEGLRNSSNLEDSSGFINQAININNNATNFVVSNAGNYNITQINGYDVTLNISRSTSINLSDSSTFTYDATITIGGGNATKTVSVGVGTNAPRDYTVSGGSIYITLSSNPNFLDVSGSNSPSGQGLNLNSNLSNIGIKIKSDYTATTPLNIYVNNGTSNELTAYFEKTRNDTRAIALSTNGGTITTYNIFTDGTNIKSYNVIVTVSRNGKQLYDISSNIQK